MNPVNNTKGQSDVIVREFAPEQVVQGVVGPWENYCDGYSNSGSSGNSYVAVLTLSTGVFKALNVDFKLESIIAYDICESGKQSDSAYIGQINMLTASSFSGVNGLVWGLQAAKNPEIDQQQPLFLVDENGKNIPVYDAKPLLDAGKVLFGSADNRRFPIAPGAHVICANKSYTTPTGPGEPVDTWAWAAIALGICEDGETQSNCFMENYGSLVCQGSTSDDIEAFKQEEIRKMARSYAYIGQDQNVFYTKVYVGFIYTRVPAGSVGCSLVCAPYVVLPKNAIPEGNPQKLLTMNLREWDQATRKYNYSTQVQQKVTQVQQKV